MARCKVCSKTVCVCNDRTKPVIGFDEKDGVRYPRNPDLICVSSGDRIIHDVLCPNIVLDKPLLPCTVTKKINNDDFREFVKKY